MPTYAVKDFESFSNLVFCVLFVDFHGHHGEELWEVDGTCPVFVNLVHHVLYSFVVALYFHPLTFPPITDFSMPFVGIAKNSSTYLLIYFSVNIKEHMDSLCNRAGEIPKFFEYSPSKPINGRPGLGQCKEN